MNKKWSYVPFDTLFEWKQKSHIKSGEGQKTGHYKMFVCSDTEIKRFDEYIESGESLVFGTGGKASCHFVDDKFAYSTDCVVAQKKKTDIYTKFYYYYFRQKRLNAIQKTFTGSGLQHTSKKKIGALLVPVVDFEEQKHIVAKIEELFSELDNSVETLQKAKQQLAVYRQAVLKDAFEIAVKCCGKLTPIENFLSEDRKGMSTGPFGTMIKKHEHKQKGVPMLGIENIGEGKFVDGNKIFVTAEKAQQLKSFMLRGGDIIISRSGTVGEICAVPKRMEGALLSTNLMRVSLNPEKVLSEYFIYMFQSKGVVLDQVKELCKGSTRVFLNQNILKQIQFPIPSIEKQVKLVAEIESQLSVCDNIEKSIEVALEQAEAMRQSILKKAFEGKF